MLAFLCHKLIQTNNSIQDCSICQSRNIRSLISCILVFSRCGRNTMIGLTQNTPFIVKLQEKHKAHNLVDITSRGLPFLKDLAELRPLANYTANGAMMDDYLDLCSCDEMMQIVKRIVALLTGEESIEPSKEENGISRQFWNLRQDAIKCGIPERYYKKYIHQYKIFSSATPKKKYITELILLHQCQYPLPAPF